MLCTEHACIILFNVYRFVKILFDELYISQDLVYDWHSSRLIGFVNLGEVDRQLADLELSTSGDTPEVSTRILTLMVSQDQLYEVSSLVYIICWCLVIPLYINGNI